ncbi:MAG: hypothetical protein KGI29_03040 [Pseudomonadota bacterium]|nr:hypothetical protein [Pseudomonadota bacterium]MDE3036919.1 hypothetical protein [Pseudomonadota bacterium]
MSTVRFFSGARSIGKQSIAGSLVRLEIQKKSKLHTADRYKHIFKKRINETRKKALNKLQTGFGIPGTFGEARKISKRADLALKEIAARKAAKQAKAERRMVVIQPRTFPNGTLNRNGKVFDIAGNIVAKVNPKTGRMSTLMGWSLGRYKPKSFLTDRALQEAIDKYSPHFINLRKLQAMQAANQQGYGVHGPSDAIVHTPSGGTNAWGMKSGNVWGTSGDNVWGTNSSNVWGDGGFDYLKGMADRVAAFFGLK